MVVCRSYRFHRQRIRRKEGRKGKGKNLKKKGKEGKDR